MLNVKRGNDQFISVFLKWTSTDLECLLESLISWQDWEVAFRPVNVSSHCFHFTCQFSLSIHRKTDDISWVVSKLQLAHGFLKEDDVSQTTACPRQSSVKSDVLVSPDVVTKCVIDDIVNNSPPSCIVFCNQRVPPSLLSSHSISNLIVVRSSIYCSPNRVSCSIPFPLVSLAFCVAGRSNDN